MRASYVLPIRWSEDQGLGELTDYLRALPDWLELIVVDDSPEELFERHASAWRGLGRHLRPDPALRTPMGKELIPASEILLTRDMTYNESIALAKEHEETLLYRAMETDIASQVLRRLASVQSL
jgi:hypothetical protein